MARWGRAFTLLDLPSGSRVLDLGCAFGFGTRLPARRYETYGHDLDPTYIERARTAVPHALFTCGPASEVPYPNGYFDGLLLLDVLEHVPDDTAVVREVARLLRPGGKLVLSVPNRGALAGLDSLNVYARLLPWARPPTDDPSWPQSPVHRHYDADRLAELLAPDFQMTERQYTGLGLAELIHLPLLLGLRPFLPGIHAIAQYLYFGAYLAEDLIPAGSWGYHLMVGAERKG
ncbi:MAG TPA: class I SAM-dependent methyltransferase [Chloroflexota bacterium]|nr:class I SAM-dependent methyltransferase [Chloroflexota bacterium]